MPDRGLDLRFGIVVMRREADGRHRSFGREVDQPVPAKARCRIDAAAAQLGYDLSGVAALHLGCDDRALLTVAVEHGTPGKVPDLAGLTAVHAGADVSLYRVPGAVGPDRPSWRRVAVVLVADGLAVAALLVLLGWWLAGRIRTGNTRRKAQRTADRPLL